jgi:ribosomal protein L11 methylase PrmA
VAALGDSTFDLVLCNMLPEEFLPLLTDLERVLARRGRLVLSGIVDERRDDVVRSLLELRLSVVGESSADEWCCLNVSRGPVEAR